MWSQLEQPSLIMPQLYLGGESVARRKETLKSFQITHILPVGYDLPRLFPEVKYFESSFEYRSLFL
jgi:hypothetical protein